MPNVSPADPMAIVAIVLVLWVRWLRPRTPSDAAEMAQRQAVYAPAVSGAIFSLILGLVASVGIAILALGVFHWPMTIASPLMVGAIGVGVMVSIVLGLRASMREGGSAAFLAIAFLAALFALILVGGGADLLGQVGANYVHALSSEHDPLHWIVAIPTAAIVLIVGGIGAFAKRTGTRREQGQ